MYTVTILYAKNLCSKSSKAQIDVPGSVKVTLKITASGQSTPVKTVTRTWTIAALTQDSNAAKTVIEGLITANTFAVTNDSTNDTVKTDLQTAIGGAHTSHTLANEYTLDATTPVTLADKTAATWNLDGSVKITVKWKKGNTAQTDIVVSAKKINKLAADTDKAAEQLPGVIAKLDKTALAGVADGDAFIKLLIPEGTSVSAYKLAWKSTTAGSTGAFAKDDTAKTITGTLVVSSNVADAADGKDVTVNVSYDTAQTGGG